MDTMLHPNAVAYEAAIYEVWEELKNCYTQENYLALLIPMTINRDLPIHMAVYSKRKQPLQHLLDVLERGDQTLLANTVVTPNSMGNTPLHKAALIGNYEAANILVQKNSKVLEMTNNVGETALFKAAAYGQTKLMKFLANRPGQMITDQMTTDKRLKDIHRHRKTSPGERGDPILHITIQGEHFGTALALLDLDITLADDLDKNGMSSLQRLATLPHAFRSGYKMGFWRSILYYCLPVFDDRSDDDFESIFEDHEKTSAENQNQNQNQDLESGVAVENQDLENGVVAVENQDLENRVVPIENQDLENVSKTTRQLKFLSVLKFLFRGAPNMLNVWKQKRQHKFALELAKLLIKRDNTMDQILAVESGINFRGFGERVGDNQGKSEEKQEQAPGQSKHEGQGQLEIALLTATRGGILEIVSEILRVRPQAVQFCSQMQQNILHAAVLYRRKQIFNWVKRMRTVMIPLVEGIDENGYSIWHCVGDITYNWEGTVLAPAHQLQNDLKWFKRVAKIVPPHFRHHRDNNGYTPTQLFIKQHEKQLEVAQKWIKGTAQSCSVVAVLVATVVFAAAYTVPGGSNERGLPNFLASPVFLFFTIMDVVSLSGSLIAIITFLSILSLPYELEDFYKSLPSKLNFGFAMLFLSLATTMMAFTATIALAIPLEPRPWTSTLICAAAFIPVGILGLMQFPLYVAFIDTRKQIFKTIRKILPLNLVRRQFLKMKSHMH